jgi:hypothetical protein
MPTDLSAGPLGHLTMFTSGCEAAAAQSLATPGGGVLRLGGLCVHVAPVNLAGGPLARDRAYWPADHPLGLTGDPVIKVASADPKQAAADLAAQAGRPDYDADRGHFNAVGYGVRFGDHAVEFLGSASGGDHDLVGGFLAGHGPGIFSTTYLVRDFGAARALLAAQDVRFTQWGRHSLLLRPEGALRVCIELTDAS